MRRLMERLRLRRSGKHYRKPASGSSRGSANLSPRFLWVFYAAGYLSAYTGFLLLFFFRKPPDFYPLWKQLLVKSHIVGVGIWLFTFGMLFSIHVIPQLKSGMRVGRRSGIFLVVVLVLMSLTGYGIQVMPTSWGIDLSRYSHLVTGMGFTALFVMHLVLVKPRLRLALVSATAVSFMLAAPFFLLKVENVFPDEIQLKPVSAVDMPAADSALVKKN